MEKYIYSIYTSGKYADVTRMLNLFYKLNNANKNRSYDSQMLG